MLGSIFFLPVDATLPSNIAPGDTFTYTISTWDVPWEDLIPPEEVPFDLANFVFDLSGSTLGVKVMDTYANGYYMLDFYVVLGKTIVIPLPDDVDPTVTDVFGTELTFDKGLGLGFGSFPGSDMTELIAETEDTFGLPFYINPTEWNTYETKLGKIDDPDVTVNVTNVEGSDFEISISGTTSEGVDIVFSVAWFRDGDNAGVFKSISGTVDGDINNDGTSNHLEIALTFDKKVQNTLPVEIINKDDMIFSLTTAEMTHSVTGFSTSLNDQIDDGLVYAADMVTDLEGLNVLKFDIQQVTGCYYDTRIEIYNPDTELLEEVVAELWWNGFTGFPVTDSDEYYMSGSPYTRWTPSIGLMPTLAPGITPDWDMWKASTISISQVLELVEKSLETFASQEEVTSFGLDLNTLDSVYELRESGNMMFFYSESQLNLDWDASKMDTMPEGLKTTSAISVEASLNSWLAYTKQGLLAGAGQEIVASISATDIPADEGSYETGSISLNVNLVLQSDQVTSIPNPEAANPVAGGDENPPALTPGFEFLVPLLIITTVVLIRKKKEH